MGDNNDQSQSSGPRLRFERLTATNYEIWINHVRDHLLSEDLEEAYDCSEVEHGEEGSEIEFPAAVAARTAKQKKVRALWSFLRNHLSEEIYRKTLDPTAVTFGDSISLLRYLRKNWHNNSVFDRANIRETFKSLTLESCKDMDDFVMQFKSQKALMTKYGIGLIASDEDALFAFHEKLPVAYKDHRLHVMANSMSYNDALSYFKNVALCFPDLPGSTHPSVMKSPESAHNSVDICRMFASTGKCRYGKKCKFSHVSQPHAATGGSGKQNWSSASGGGNKFSGKCNFCGIKGHKENECRKKKREAAKANEAAAAAKEPAKNPSSAPSTSKSLPAPSAPSLPMLGDNSLVSLSDLSFMLFEDSQIVDKVGFDMVAAAQKGLLAPAVPKGDLCMLVDGGATSVIIQDRTKLVNLRPANIAIKVGGGFLYCKWVGDFYYVARANGKFIANHAVARYMPDFGFDVLPEAIYLAAGAKMVKCSKKVEATKGNEVWMTAEKHPQCWLYFSKITPISPPPNDTKFLCPFLPKEKTTAAAQSTTIAAAQECSDSASFALGYAYPSFVEIAHISIDSDSCEGASSFAIHEESHTHS